MSDPLLPTPKAERNRNSRKAITSRDDGKGGTSDMGLEQAIEVVQGILPHELQTASELPEQYRRRMSEPLLPTPRGQDSYERRNRKTKERIRDEGGDMTLPTFVETSLPTSRYTKDPLLPTPQAHDAAKGEAKRHKRHGTKHGDANLNDHIAHISASSLGSEDSTSPSKPSASDASDRSSGTSPAQQSSLDIGPTFPDGLRLRSSALLPTPKDTATRNSRRALTQQHFSDLALEQAIEVAQGILPRELDSPDELPPQHRRRWTSSAEGSHASPSATPASARDKRTTAGSGPSSPVLLASWDRDLCFWRTSQGSLLSTEDERFPRSWERWPTSGTTRSGTAYALPMLALPTGGSGSSYLLATPNATLSEWGSPYYGARKNLNTFGQVKALNVPTPTSSDSVWAERDHSRRGIVGNHNLGLVDWARLLPTPKSQEGGWKVEPHHEPGHRAYQEMADGRVINRTWGVQQVVDSLGDLTKPPSEGGSE